MGMTKPEQIRDIVQSVRCGQVVTYGCISKRVYGHSKAGQAVGQAIKAHEDSAGFPWWRVVDSKRRPIKEGQRGLLEREGVKFTPDGRVSR